MSANEFAEKTLSGLLQLPESTEERQEIVEDLEETERIAKEGIIIISAAVKRIQALRERRKHANGRRK